MRKLILFLITIIGVTFITSCKKDEVKAVLGTNFTAPAITAGLVNSSTTVVLAKANKDVAFDVIWTGAYYGFRGSVTYTVQMDKKGNNFAAPLSLGSPASTVLNSTYAISLITNDLNNKLLTMQADPENPVATAVEFRVKAYLNDSVPVLYSPVISSTYTPYFIPIIYAKVYVPGGYQAASGYTSDWAPDKAPYLASLAGNGKYEGYVYFNATSAFKVTANPDWNGPNYGAGTTAGSISATGGDISTPAVGYYRVRVNTNELTIELFKTTWSMIGSTVGPGFNWSNDLDFTYDPATKLWTARADLKAGAFKIRANHDWGFAYGMGASAGKLDSSGGDITLAADGNYTVTLNFSVPPIYRITFVKN